MTEPKYFCSDHVSLSSHILPAGPCKIIQSMRSDLGVALYRVRSDTEPFERVVAERDILTTADAVFAVTR